jgi:hypothetical protein
MDGFFDELRRKILENSMVWKMKSRIAISANVDQGRLVVEKWASLSENHERTQPP